LVEINPTLSEFPKLEPNSLEELRLVCDELLEKLSSKVCGFTYWISDDEKGIIIFFPKNTETEELGDYGYSIPLKEIYADEMYNEFIEYIRTNKEKILEYTNPVEYDYSVRLLDMIIGD
jgi:hypothetical protein